MTTATEPKPRPSQRVVSDKRESILEAALDLFVERGFFGTAVPEIAERAGVGAGTIYRYFESKEALVNVIYRQQKTYFAKGVMENMFAGAMPTTRELFRTLWMRMSTFAIGNPKGFVFMELHHHGQYLDAESRALELRMKDLFTSVLTGAQARGEIKAGDPCLLMGIVLGAFIGVIRVCIENDKPLASADWKLAEQALWEAIRA